MSENVNHPDHYKAGELECIDVIRAVLGDEGFSAFCLGNAFKYLWRHGKKNGVEDLKKATVYIDWLIQSDVKVEANKRKELFDKVAEQRKKKEDK